MLAATTVSLQAQEIKFTEGSFAEIKAKAKAENKLIFVDAYATWCGPCKWMAKNVFTNDTVGKFYNEKFINYTLDIEKGEGMDFAKDNKINSVPVLFYLDSTGRVLHKATGAKDVKELITLGEKALNPELRLATWQNRYSNGKGNRTPEFIRNYLNVLDAAGMGWDDETVEIAKWYFAIQKDADLLTKENFEMIDKFEFYYDNPAGDYFLKNKEKFYALAGKEKVDKKIYNLYRMAFGSVSYYLETSDTNDYATIINGSYYKLIIKDSLFNALMEEVKNSKFESSDKLILEANIKYYKMKKDWKKNIEYLDTYIHKYKMNEWDYLNNTTYTEVYENEKITDKETLQKALVWINRSIELESNYYNNDTQAALLYKMGKKKEAIKAAEKSIALAKKEGVDATSTEELLKKIKGK